ADASSLACVDQGGDLHVAVGQRGRVEGAVGGGEAHGAAVDDAVKAGRAPGAGGRQASASWLISLGGAGGGALPPVPDRLGGELGAGGDVKLGENVREMGLHGPARDVQPLADLGVGQSLGDQVDHSLLAGGEALPAALRAAVRDVAAAADTHLPQRGASPG